MKRVLIIDDEEKLRTLMARIIALEGGGCDVALAESAASARRALMRAEFDVIICDVKLPDANGVDLIKEIKEKQPLSEVILLTAYGNIPDGVQAIKNGAFDYITKGDDNSRIIPLLHRAFEKVELARRINQLERQVGERYSFEMILGKSKGIQEAVVLGRKVAQTDTTVLLLGETGTGKEVFAQAIHYAGSRKNKTYIALNCAAFSKELLESELFGHKAGAFTGALKDKKGIFEEADGGTIFLDEIGEMAPELQAKLLRVLEAGEFLKVGSTQPLKVNVRIIAATNRNLENEIEAGHFRHDLFYRLSVFSIYLPPLRERIKDIPVLADSFAQFYGLKLNKRSIKLSADYIEALEQNPWKGNIRELKNIIERSLILSEGDTLDIDCLPYEFRNNKPNGHKCMSAFAMASAEKLHIQKVLNHTRGNKAEAARLLEIGVATLYRKIEEYGL